MRPTLRMRKMKSQPPEAKESAGGRAGADPADEAARVQSAPPRPSAEAMSDLEETVKGVRTPVPRPAAPRNPDDAGGGSEPR